MADDDRDMLCPGRVIEVEIGHRPDSSTSAVATMDRDNETWLANLGGTGPDQQAALSDLRDALLRGLQRALSHRAGIGGEFMEDVVQDSLLRILERLPQFEGRSRFLTWAMSIAIRLAMSELRRRRWKDVSLDEVTAGGDLPPERAIADDPARTHNRSARRSSPRCTK